MTAVPVVATSRDHLIALVNAEIQAHGVHCDLNHVDVSNITNMEGLFAMTKFNGDISAWDTSNVESMVEMFYDCPFNGDISRWNTSKVERMANMFQRSSFSGNISQWDTRNVRYFQEMFLNSAFVGDISNWTVYPKNARELSNMFSDEQVARLSAPNMYCWVVAISFPEFSLRPEWITHLHAILPPLLGLGLPVVDAARMVHQAWQERHLDVELIELPALD